MCEGKPHPTSPKRSEPPVRDPAAIQALVRSHYSELRVCYEEVLGRDPEARGQMQTRFVIDKHGAVTSACLERADIDDHDGGECLLEEFRELRFPTAASDLTVIYPIRFVPDAAANELPDGPPPPRGRDPGLQRLVVDPRH